jgi:hypothetical protein
MPKSFSDSDKARWLEQYEKGESEKAIARSAKCDVRTVKRALQELQLRQDAKVARVELVKDALRRHQDALLGQLDSIISTLTFPSEDWEVLAWLGGEGSILQPPQRRANRTRQGGNLAPARKGSRPIASGSVLRDHLKNDRLWKVLAWRSAAAEEDKDARMDFQMKVVAVLEKKTGLKVTDNVDGPPPFLYSYTAGDLVYRTVLRRSLGNRETPDLDAQVVIDQKQGAVKYRGLVLAQAPEQEEKVRDEILKAVKDLEASGEAARVVAAHRKLKEETGKARLVAEQIRSLGMIPGLCEICRRLGLR